MPKRSGLVGRQAERERLAAAVAAGRGSAPDRSSSSRARPASARPASPRRSPGTPAANVLWGRASRAAAVPYGPIAAALRSHLRADPAGLDAVGPLGAHLALILPELGDPAAASDRATLFEAIRCALAQVAAAGPAIVVLDDLQWSDEATLELLPALAELAARHVAARGRRPTAATASRATTCCAGSVTSCAAAGGLDELVAGPARRERRPAELLAEVLGDAPAPSLVRAIHDRTQGVPFFVEELARALSLDRIRDAGTPRARAVRGGRRPGPRHRARRRARRRRGASPRRSGRPPTRPRLPARRSISISSPGSPSAAGLDGALRVRPGRRGRRRHRRLPARARPRGALRRRSLAAAAGRCTGGSPRRSVERGARSIEIASHWLGAREAARAREALLSRAAESRAHARPPGRGACPPPGARPVAGGRGGGAAHRGARAVRRQLQSSPASCRRRRGHGGRSARCAPSAATGRRSPRPSGGWRACTTCKGDREAAFAARRAAAEAYADGGQAGGGRGRAPRDGQLPARLGRLHRARSSSPAPRPRTPTGPGGSTCACARSGSRASRWPSAASSTRGSRPCAAGSPLALEHDLTPAAAELYQRLSMVLYDAADYRRAQETLDTALALCRTSGDAGTEVACVTCMVYVLRECGDWPEALRLGHELIAVRHGGLGRRGARSASSTRTRASSARRGGCCPPRSRPRRGSATST